jgi:3-phosphoshikimate 1-carboxyvinyltransferase
MYEQIGVLEKTSTEVFEARIPGSKSYTNRALVMAAHRIGRTEIHNALHCDDTIYLAEALDGFGGLSVQKTAYGFEVARSAETLKAPQRDAYIGGAGTPGRFLLSFATFAEGETLVNGNERLCQRPMEDILIAMRKMGVAFRCLKSEGHLPVKVTGGKIASKEWTVCGSTSSQFLSSLLITASRQESGPIEIEVTGNLVSKTYVEMTLAYLRQCGIRCSHTDYQRFIVHPGKYAIADDRLDVETDASGMSYFLVAAAITGTTVRIPRIGKDSMQGDLGLALALEKMGCSLEMGTDSLTLTGGDLHGIEIDMEDMPDTVLSLAIAATLAKGETHIKNIANLRVKECDRIHATCHELSKLGVKVKEGNDYLVIHPTRDIRPARIETYDDHRVAMAFGLFKLLYDGIDIEKPGCVAKSFPQYWQELSRFIRHQRGITGGL